MSEIVGTVRGIYWQTPWSINESWLVKSVAMSLRLTAAATTDTVIQKKTFGSDITALIISKEEMKKYP